MSGEPPLTILPTTSRPLLEAVRAVLSTPHLPPVALIGGLAVTMHVSAAGTAHRATTDIDLVTVHVEPAPEAVELIAAAHHSEQHPLIVGDVKVDIIPTNAIADGDLDGFEDHHRLFLAGHRWAFETAEATRLATPDSQRLTVRVASPAGLVAAKSHAVGYPSTARRALKHGSDLLDLFRLVDLYDVEGSVTRQLRTGPSELARIIADIAEREIVENPAAATNTMASASPTPIDTEHVTVAIEAFVDGLRR